MTKNQIYNLYSFILCISNLGEKNWNHSPSYILEKLDRYIIFEAFDKLIDGKSEFYLNEWKEYCDRWNVDEDNYKLLNTVIFLSKSIKLILTQENSQILKNFQKYIGKVEDINKIHISSGLNPVLHDFMIEHFQDDDRFFKLLTLKHDEI